VLEFFQHQRWAEFRSLATVGHRVSERAVGSQASSRSSVDVVACVLRWAFDLIVLACRRRVSRVELMSEKCTSGQEENGGGVGWEKWQW